MSTGKLIDIDTPQTDTPQTDTPQASHTRASPGWLVEPSGWFDAGVPDLKYMLKDDQDYKVHYRRIEKYHDQQGKLFRKAMKRLDSVGVHGYAREMYECDQVRIRLLGRTHRATVVLMDKKAMAGANASVLHDHLRRASKWLEWLEKAREEKDTSPEVKVLRELGEI